MFGTKRPKFEHMLQLDTKFGHCDELRIDVRGANLIANVQYFRTAGTFTRSIAFEFVEAHSLHAEPMLPLYAKHCVDQVCEVTGSEWIDRIRERLPANGGTFRHFAIYFTKCGLLEVLCDRIVIGPEVAGTLAV